MRCPARLLAIVAALVVLAGTAQAQNAAPTPGLLPDEVAAIAVHDVAIRSVVMIEASSEKAPTAPPAGLEKFWPKSLGEPQRSRAVGSGVLWDAAGHVITTAGLSSTPADKLKVTLPDGRSLPARLVGTDADLGVSVLQVDGALAGMQPVTAGASGKLRVGQRLYVLGTAWGRGFLLLEGMLAGTGPEFTDNGYPTLLLTATVNPGNAGGAVFDTGARFVGLIQGLYGTGGNANNGAVTLVLPSDELATWVPQLIASGHVTRAVLDIAVADTSSLTPADGMPAGVPVGSVEPGGAGARAGLRGGDDTNFDVITAIDGVAVRALPELRAQLARHRPGDACTLTVWRAGKSLQLTVTLSASKR